MRFPKIFPDADAAWALRDAAARMIEDGLRDTGAWGSMVFCDVA